MVKRRRHHELEIKQGDMFNHLAKEFHYRLQRGLKTLIKVEEVKAKGDTFEL